MIANVQRQPMSPAEYLAWEAEQPLKHEILELTSLDCQCPLALVYEEVELTADFSSGFPDYSLASTTI